MNVAICSAGDLFGGVERFIVTFASELTRLPEQQVQVVLFSKGVLADTLHHEGIAATLFETPRYDITVIARIARFFRGAGIDVVHTHGYKATLLCGAAARLCGARTVKTEHGSPEPCRGVDGVKMSVNTSLDRALSRYLVDRIVYVSNDIRQRHGKYYAGIPGEVIYNGIPRWDAQPFARPRELDDRCFNIGIVGRLTAVKGHQYLLQAIKELALADLRLYVLGDGELEDELERRAHDYGLDERVFFLGFRRNADEYLRALDVVVMPSLHEGFPYTMLEAGYWGAPLIASRVGGIQEVLTDGLECLLVEPRDVGQLAGAIRTLHDNPELRHTLGRNARHTVTERFLIDDMVGKYLATYAHSLDGRLH
jgi:glycosyltransferase involved in cell wall biosynthesis